MEQVRRLKPIGVAELGGAEGPRWVRAHGENVTPPRGDTRRSHLVIRDHKRRKTPYDLAEGDCGLCELKPPGA